MKKATKAIILLIAFTLLFWPFVIYYYTYGTLAALGLLGVLPLIFLSWILAAVLFYFGQRIKF